MKKIIVVAAGVLCLWVSLVSSSQAQTKATGKPARPKGKTAVPAVHRKPGGIVWAKSLPAALAQSAKDGRPVITYFTFDT